MKPAAFFSILMLIFQPSAFAAPDNPEALLADCRTLDECFSALEADLPEVESEFDISEVESVATILKARFSDEAKSALLDRALNGSGDWRASASIILWAWGDWKEEDIPALRTILKQDHGNAVARALGEIGTPEAIDALVENFPYTHPFSPTGFALRAIGPEVLRRMLPALEVAPYVDETGFQGYPGWLAAKSLIAGFGSKAMIADDEWIAVALNRREKPERRLAALRGLAALNGYLHEKGAALRPLLKHRNDALASEAYETLRAVRDPSVARRVAEACIPTEERWTYLPDSFFCLRELSEFGGNAAVAGDLVLPFLDSQNPLEQALGIETLGLIGYRDAIADIEPFLTSSDWRAAYAAIMALGQLHSFGSVEAIEDAGSNYWLPPLGAFAQFTTARIKQRQPYGGRSFKESFGDYDEVFKSEQCEWEVWSHEGVQISFEKATHGQERTIALTDGELIATDMGEFGGALEWRPNAGEPVTLVPDNTGAIFRVAGGFLSMHSLAHIGISYGYATLASRDASGAWTVKEVARFPGAAYEFKRLYGDVFAAKAAGYAVIFSPDGIAAAAECDWMADPRRVQ